MASPLPHTRLTCPPAPEEIRAMTDERDRSGPPNQPYSGEPDRGDGGSRDGYQPRDPNPNGQPRQGFQDQEGGGVNRDRGPRRSRYGRRRGPSDGPGEGGEIGRASCRAGG